MSIANVKSSLKPEFQNKTLLTRFKNPLTVIQQNVSFWVILSLIFLVNASNGQYISFHLQTNNMTNALCKGPCQRKGSTRSQVWVQAARAYEAMCTLCAEVNCRVSRLGVLNVQGEVLGCLIQQHSKSLVFLCVLIWMNVYNQLWTFSRHLLIPGEVAWGAVWISTVDNRAFPLLDSQGRRMLLQSLPSAHP